MARKKAFEYTSTVAATLSTDARAAERAQARRQAIRQLRSALTTIAFGFRLLWRALGLLLGQSAFL